MGPVIVPPVRPVLSSPRMSGFAWVDTAEEIKERIQKTEAFVGAVVDLFCSFLSVSQEHNSEAELKRAGSALRDYLCCEHDQKLREMETNPIPDRKALEELYNPKPTTEHLMQAVEDRDAARDQRDKLLKLIEEESPGYEMAEAMFLPALNSQLRFMDESISRMQKRMEEVEGKTE